MALGDIVGTGERCDSCPLGFSGLGEPAWNEEDVASPWAGKGMGPEVKEPSGFLQALLLLCTLYKPASSSLSRKSHSPR